MRILDRVTRLLGLASEVSGLLKARLQLAAQAPEGAMNRASLPAQRDWSPVGWPPRSGEAPVPCSLDAAPWRHPFLTAPNISRFRGYSEQVWSFAQAHSATASRPLSVGFMINMAQNMYKWACMARRQGIDAELYLNAMDGSALSCPEWEEFDGEFGDVLNAEEFLTAHPNIRLEVPCHRVPLEDWQLLSLHQRFLAGERGPLLHLLASMPGVRHEVLLAYQGFYPYARWAAELNRHDVLYAASSPFPAYASGRPYCVFAVGGDLQIDCGRADDYGRAMALAFNAARFLMVSNPHALGHSRRLALTNGVYLPYPVDEVRYCPGESRARVDWEARCGRGVYVLTTARLDAHVKGFGVDFVDVLVGLARQCPSLRFVFLAWGKDSHACRQRLEASPVRGQFLFLPPVGKRRLIDYYRAADVILDQLVYGYYGATALEAAAIGKPVVMHLRAEHYAPLYAGEVMPALVVRDHADLRRALLQLAGESSRRDAHGVAMRSWLVRHHGTQRTMPLLTDLLRLAADRVPLPTDLVNPLASPLNEDEIAYHASCLVPAS